MFSRRLITSVPTIVVAVLLAVVAVGSQAAAAQDGEVGIVGVAYTCPDTDVEPSAETCDTIEGVSIQVEVNGAEIAGSPFTTDLNSIGFNSIEFSAPEDATITLTQLSGIPDGYVPAPGSDPFTANVADLPIRGTGGESTSPYALLVNVPAGDDGGAGDDGTDDTTTLPETGAGTAQADSNRDAALAGLLATGALLLGAGYLALRMRMR